MSTWKTYAKAARNTARRQAPDLARQASDSARRSSERAGSYVRAAGRAAEEGTRDSRGHLRERGARYRRDAAIYTEVSRRHLKRARIGQRLLAALRDALIMGLSLGVIWFVVTRTGVQIPFTAVLVIVLLLMVVRFGWALFSGFGGGDEEDDEPDAEDLEDEQPDADAGVPPRDDERGSGDRRREQREPELAHERTRRR
jgi:hypothetical protein